jgi:hypothetical protein
MAALAVRSGSVPFARLEETAGDAGLERTGANGRERLPAFAMQKVVGSSPIIRSSISPPEGGLLVSTAAPRGRLRGVG